MKQFSLENAAKIINDRCSEMWENPEVMESVIKNIMAEKSTVTEYKIIGSLFTFFTSPWKNTSG